MWIPILLYLLSSIADECLADTTEECQILQTTDPRTPCYILICQVGVEVPPFLYMLNIPRSSEDLPCPASQTLDPTLTCYLPYNEPDAPAFVLNTPLPPNADELDESPSGRIRLREAKANPLFKPLNNGVANFQQHTAVSHLKTRNLGPPSPYLTTAVFRPLAPSQEFTEAPTIRTQDHHDFPTRSPSPKRYQFKYHIIHYNSPFQRRLPYSNRELSSSGASYPYPAGEGSGTITAFQGPYPPPY